ncbi:glycosyltransferase family 4 protein [Rhabdothermincola salaria]|uniref:glycosyltransferase family 4 protein n=1 Tax=Rhabdothermincola salaria TaxID=2903142 RepID=UPI001E3B3E60|nr:glycosyltransferase family 4 protein [Rhabdothermincola salaria]
MTLEQCWHSVPGGTAQAALESVRALQVHGQVAQIGVSARHRHDPATSWVPPIPVVPLPLPRLALYESWHRLRRPPVQRATGPVDVIHATGMAVPPPSAPLVVTVHDLAFTHDPSQFTRRGVAFFRRAIDLARRDATLVMAPSRATLDECRAQGFDPDRLRLVPWGIEPRPVAGSEVEAFRARHGLEGRYVLWAGTIEPRKNLPVLLDAFAALARRDVTLVLAGPQGWNEDLTPRLAALGERVRPVGFLTQDDLRAAYAGADVFCFPSRQEGFGLPVLEAMAQGTPVVTSAGTATAEVAGETGVLVDPEDVGGLGDALGGLLDDPDRRARLGTAGHDRARDHFSWAATAAALEAVYHEAASRGGPS